MTANLDAPAEFRFSQDEGALYCVTLSVHVGLAFASQPTERELRQAMVENFLSNLGTVRESLDEDEFLAGETSVGLSYEFIDIEPI